MSDSASESSSSEDYNGRRSRIITPDGSIPSQFSRRSSHSRPKSPTSSVSSRGKTVSPQLSGRDSPRSLRTGIASPKSSRSGPMSPKSPKSPSEPDSPRSNPSSIKSDPTSSKSYRSHGNSLDSPRSDHSGPMTPKSYVSGPASPRSRDVSPNSPSYRNVESRREPSKSPQSNHSSPKHPRSGYNIGKPLSSERNSPNMFKSGSTLYENDRNFDKRSTSRSPVTKKNAFNELGGEQISDGDIEDEPEVSSKVKSMPITHGEDLSDVSDLDSMDGVDEPDPEPQTNFEPGRDRDRDRESQRSAEEKKENEGKSAPASLAEESEQLDFEADGQWKDEREDGETDVLTAKESKETKKDFRTEAADKDKSKCKELGEMNEKEEGEEDGEKVESELEEGELSDGEDARPEETEPRPVCRFYNRGQCTWGVSCRFLHPGVTDKGNYTMFDMVRPMAYPPHASGPHEFRPHIERPSIVRPLHVYGAPPHTPKVEEVPTESAWERGLRHAKEMMRKANKRKESDMDFEEKKMNLSLGQDELDREAGYYVRPATPEPPVERWPAREVPRRAPLPRGGTPERFIEETESYYPPSTAPPEYYRRVHYKAEIRPGADYRERLDYHPVPRGAPHSVSPPPHSRDRERERERERDREQREYYEKYEKKHKRPSREVIVERIPPNKPWREEEPPVAERGRGDEWADPWMRRKSPSAVRRNPTSSRRPRRQSYSSGSSYSSTRSRSPSPPSRSRMSAKGKAAPNSPPGPTPAIISSGVAPGSATGAVTVPAATQRGAMLMNPPAPSPRPPKGSISPTTATLHRRAGLNPPAPSPLSSHHRHHEKGRDKTSIVATAVTKGIKNRSRSRSSRSSSGSDTSGSSSDTTESSYSSSSTESRRKKGMSPSAMRKESKSIDTLKLSDTKQQIKLSLKPSNNVPAVKKVDRSAVIAGKKRAAIDSPPHGAESKASVAAAAAKAAKKASSRREELLKQLKAVEDAIARKRSKV
ncbi:zinc finger CCCH domain-containing protein 18 isoform X2 [Cephus cinctus]|uniref:Zinc finger CCCH domain-containing protein 18 isoform X2 n=1 Tax=Cephus cinctus TaxID=211228 RepID=A0AAJ7CAM5_CEPCN|nr:zinc finger CCCH domain-containing protein 18 isoform X2 [Cephus cinctus]